MSTQERIDMLTGAVEKLEADNVAATERIAAMQAAYDSEALSRLASGNAQAATAARKEIAEAQAEADDLKTGLEQTRTYLRQAQDELAAEREEATWAKMRAAADLYVAAVAELQAAVETLVAKHLAVAPLAEQLVRLAPVRINSAGLTETQRVHDLRMYLTRLAGDRIGKLGVTTDPQFVASQPTLVEHARAMVMGLLSHRKQAAQTTTGDAA